MNTERWRKVEQLYHAALEQKPGERAAFIETACAGDQALRQEVESLLAHEDQAESFIEASALDATARMLAQEHSGLIAGRRIGSYEIVALLGAGGMGEVYQARDVKLDRSVALKFLPPGMQSDRSRMKRFVAEAKAASALSHANVAHIYEIGEADGLNYIAMEYVEGVTLASKIGRRPLPPAQVVEIGLQVADALSEAHSKGIVHRDIKSANIMLKPQGQVKVLDFGLAKISPIDSIQSRLTTMPLTTPGTLLGTIDYMSPEQVLGRDVDHRSDIFSLGVVLYQMATGRLPFSGKTATETMDHILHAQPEAISRFNTVPAELESIAAKCLEKEPAARYRSAQELLSDLKALKRVLDSGSLVPPVQRALDIDSAFQPAHYQPARIPLLVRRPVVLTTVIACLVAGVLIYLFVNWLNAPATVPQMRSLVVLPLQNLTGDPGQEYFVDGMTETLISNLANIKALRVISRTSAMHYKGTTRTLPQIAGELKVDTVVEGSVQRAQDRVRITIQIIDGPSDRHLWAGAYENDLRDVLLLQSQMAQAIAREVRLQLTPQDKIRLAATHPVIPEAFQAYLKGRYYWNKRTAEGLQKAVEQFQQAIGKDPNYALAFAGLADCYAAMDSYGSVPTSEIIPKAKDAALRALEIDDSLVEAHTSLGLVYQKSWKWGDAEKEYKHAFSLNPNYPSAHQWYSMWLRDMGRVDEALAEMKLAQELDPLSLVISVNVAREYLQKGDFNLAIEQCKKVIALDPNYHLAHTILAFIYEKQRRYPEAIAEARRSVDLSGNGSTLLAALGYCYARAGRRTEAVDILRNLEDRYGHSKSDGAHLAWVYAGLGDKDKAFAWLEKDFRGHSGVLPGQIKMSTPLDTLRDDSRYANLLHRIGLPF